MNDVVGINEDTIRKVREFLYVDHERIRSYYSQLNRGVIESVIARGSQNVSGGVAAQLFGFGPSVSGERQREIEESRSLQDLNYVIFEELFEKENLIKEITDYADELSVWESGEIYTSIDEGQILRYTGNLQILDPAFVQERFSQFGKLASAITGFQVGPQEPQRGSPPGPGSRRPWIRAAVPARSGTGGYAATARARRTRPGRGTARRT